MNRRHAFLLCPAAVAVGITLLYVTRRRQPSPLTVSEAGNTLRQLLAEARALHRTLRRQRGAINDIHKYLITVPKGS